MIKLYEDYVIEIDPKNYIFGRLMTRKNKDTGEEEKFVQRIAYYNRLVDALKCVRRYFIKEKLKTVSVTLAEACVAIREADEAFAKLLEEKGLDTL